jgi:hypothetical protein
LKGKIVLSIKQKVLIKINKIYKREQPKIKNCNYGTKETCGKLIYKNIKNIKTSIAAQVSERGTKERGFGEASVRSFATAEKNFI